VSRVYWEYNTSGRFEGEGGNAKTKVKLEREPNQTASIGGGYREMRYAWSKLLSRTLKEKGRGVNQTGIKKAVSQGERRSDIRDDLLTVKARESAWTGGGKEHPPQKKKKGDTKLKHLRQKKNLVCEKEPEATLPGYPKRFLRGGMGTFQRNFEATDWGKPPDRGRLKKVG